MSDAYLDHLLDELVTAEPRPAWDDVLGRARRSRRRYGLVAAVVAMLVLAPVSWAVAHAFEGSPPPQSISAAVQHLNALVPQLNASVPAADVATAEVSKLHGVMQVQTADGPLDLWAAPSTNGGVCEWIAFEGDLQPGANGGSDGGCLNPPLKLVADSLQSDSGHPSLYIAYGYTSIPSAATATVTLSDGRSATIPVVEGWYLTTFDRKPGTPDFAVTVAMTTIADASGNQLAEWQAPNS
jgi:hypothetical protein